MTPDAFVARADDGEHLAGKLAFDKVAPGGPRIDVEFNVTLFKEFEADRKRCLGCEQRSRRIVSVDNIKPILGPPRRGVAACGALAQPNLRS